MYFTPAGPRRGPILYREGLGDIEVLRSRGDRTPIGRASPVGSTEGGVAVWRLTLCGAEVSGRWIVLGCELLPTQTRRRRVQQKGRGPSK